MLQPDAAVVHYLLTSVVHDMISDADVVHHCCAALCTTSNAQSACTPVDM
jgi:hypothetical protein